MLDGYPMARNGEADVLRRCIHRIGLWWTLGAFMLGISIPAFYNGGRTLNCWHLLVGSPIVSWPPGLI